MNRGKTVVLFTLWIGLAGSVQLNAQTPSGTAFTYQGRLSEAGDPVDGIHDLRFVLYDGESGGGTISGPVDYLDYDLDGGLVNVELDFGGGAFAGDARWLEVRIRPGADTGAFTVLRPRLRLTPAPHSIYAATAGTVLWSGLTEVPSGFADGIDHTNDTVQFSEISDIIGTGASEVAAGNHLHDGRYYRETELQGSGLASVHWDNLTNMPAGFADGVDHTNDNVSFPEISGIVGEGAQQVALGSHDHNGRYYLSGEPVPSALTLEPGAVIEGPPMAWDGWLLQLNMTGAYPLATGLWSRVATGSAVIGNSTGGYGVYGYSQNGNAVVAFSGAKTAGVFHSGDGYGIEVSTSGIHHWDHAGRFIATQGHGIYAFSDAQNGIRAVAGYDSGVTTPGGRVGVVGLSGDGRGVYGASGHEEGVYGVSNYGYGVYGYSASSHGVYGRSSATSAAGGYGGCFVGTNYRGLYAKGGSGQYAGYFDGPLYVNGDLYASGSKAGYVVDVALNEDGQSLETGDVVVVAGYSEPVAGEVPVMRVRKAAESGSSGVVGVVDRAFEVGASPESVGETLPRAAAKAASIAGGTPIVAGDYLSVVTHGAFKAVKADASYGAIRPGDLLVASANPGHAMRAEEPKAGTIIGKALGTLEQGTGVVPVLVTLQ